MWKFTEVRCGCTWTGPKIYHTTSGMGMMVTGKVIDFIPDMQ